MDWKLDLQSLDGVTVGIATGRMQVSDIKDGARIVWRAVDGPDLRILWDFRDVVFDIDGDDVRELADFVKSQAPDARIRNAFVVSTELAFGLLRMFETYREHENVRTSVFRDREPALDWLHDDEG